MNSYNKSNTKASIAASKEKQNTKLVKVEEKKVEVVAVKQTIKVASTSLKSKEESKIIPSSSLLSPTISTTAQNLRQRRVKECLECHRQKPWVKQLPLLINPVSEVLVPSMPKIRFHRRRRQLFPGVSVEKYQQQWFEKSILAGRRQPPPQEIVVERFGNIQSIETLCLWRIGQDYPHRTGDEPRCYYRHYIAKLILDHMQYKTVWI